MWISSITVNSIKREKAGQVSIISKAAQVIPEPVARKLEDKNKVPIIKLVEKGSNAEVM